MPHTPHSLWLAPLGLALLAGCVPAITVDEESTPEALDRDESRTIELRYLRLDAKGFAQTLTKADIKKNFPERVLRETWLLDMPLEHLITNALTILVATPEEEAYTLPQSSLNMWKLLNMTPANTDLAGSSLEGLLGIGEAVGLAPSVVLSDLIGIEANTGIISVATTTPAVIKHVVSTHPNAQLRRGPVTAENPDGLYPVKEGSMPVSLWDVVTDFQDLKVTFGPAAFPREPDRLPHPGFVKDASPILAATDAFEMTVRVDLNALPYKGVDLTDASVASINSTSSQIAHAFNFATDDWMEIKGLVDNLVIGEMVMAIYENPQFIASGASQKPAPLGDSPVWDLPEWQFERLIAEVAVLRSENITPHCTVYSPEGEVEMPLKAVNVCMGDNGVADDGAEPDAWVSLSVDPSVVLDEPPPPPSYFWDVLLEVAQLRLHDGGLAEGQGDIAFSLKNIAAGISTAELEQNIRANIKANPSALAAIAELLNENSDGAADFFYVHAGADEKEPTLRGDWLYFITPDDIQNDTNGAGIRPYGYKRPGFYSDRGGKQKLSSKTAVAGDSEHEKVKIASGDVLYTQDDEGSVFKIEVGPKPDRHLVSLTITRL